MGGIGNGLGDGRDADEQEGSRSDPLVQAAAAAPVWTDIHRVGRLSCPRDRHRRSNPSTLGRCRPLPSIDVPRFAWARVKLRSEGCQVVETRK
jgi:hypothetical protein